MKQIVLISGKQGSGKTTLCSELQKLIHKKPKTGYRFFNFADVIYDIHNFALGRLSTYGFKRDIVKDGKLLQLLGTEWGRDSIDKDIWCKVLRGKIERDYDSFCSGFDRVVYLVGDCRFRNEFDSFPESLRVRLHCPEIVRKSRCSAN